jgi:hypothetical protein
MTAAFAGLLRFGGGNSGKPHGLTTVKNTPESNFFCQESLTKSQFSVENRDTYLASPHMAFGKLGRGLALAGALAATEPALADAPSPSMQLAAMTNGQVTDCVAFVQEQRDLAAENGIVMGRRDQMTMLAECRGGQLQERIAEQQQIIAVLNERIAHLRMRIDANNRIIDENDQVIAFIVAINGQWVIQRQLETDIAASRERQEQMLREFESILQALVTS